MYLRVAAALLDEAAPSPVPGLVEHNMADDPQVDPGSVGPVDPPDNQRPPSGAGQAPPGRGRSRTLLPGPRWPVALVLLGAAVLAFGAVVVGNVWPVPAGGGVRRFQRPSRRLSRSQPWRGLHGGRPGALPPPAGARRRLGRHVRLLAVGPAALPVGHAPNPLVQRQMQMAEAPG